MATKKKAKKKKSKEITNKELLNLVDEKKLGKGANVSNKGRKTKKKSYKKKGKK